MNRFIASVLAIFVAVVGFNPSTVEADTSITISGNGASSQPPPPLREELPPFVLPAIEPTDDMPDCEKNNISSLAGPGGLYLAPNVFAALPCKMKVAVYDVNGQFDFNKRSYDLFGYKEAAIPKVPRVGDYVFIGIDRPYNTYCPSLAFALFGWDGPPKAQLTIFDQGYPSQYLGFNGPVKLGAFGYQCKTLVGTTLPPTPDPLPSCVQDGIYWIPLAIGNRQHQGPCKVTIAFYDPHGKLDDSGPQDLFDSIEMVLTPSDMDGLGKTFGPTMQHNWACYMRIYILVGWEGPPLSRVDAAHQYPATNLAGTDRKFNGYKPCDKLDGTLPTNSTVGDGPIVTGPTIACATMDIVNVFNNVDHCGKTGPNDGSPFSPAKPGVSNNNTTTVTIGPAPYPRPPATGNTENTNDRTSLKWWMAWAIPLLAVSPVLACTAKRK